jgi:hypothetical protein
MTNYINYVLQSLSGCTLVLVPASMEGASGISVTHQVWSGEFIEYRDSSGTVLMRHTVVA